LPWTYKTRIFQSAGLRSKELTVVTSAKTDARWLRIAIAFFAVIALVRGFGLVLHKPIIALANNFDQIRLTTCLDVGPFRPGVPPENSNPQAPLRFFSFYDAPSGACYWSSDLIFTAPTAMGWKLAENLTGNTVHSVRGLGMLRLLTWIVVGAWATRAWIKAGYYGAAFANVVWLGIVGADPANTIYLNAFYSEPSALLGLYLCIVGAGLTQATQRRAALLITLVGACLLATSKFQHLALPACLAIGVLCIRAPASRRIALVLALGSVVGIAAAAFNRIQSPPLMQSISSTNRADFILSALLLNVDDPRATATQLGLSADCAARANVGGVFGLDAAFEEVCPGISAVSSAAAWNQLIRSPSAWAKIATRVPSMMVPWIPFYLGLVEAKPFAKLPTNWPSLSDAIGSHVPVAVFLLFLPWVVLLLSIRAGPTVRTHAAMCAVVIVVVPAVAILGDGYLDFQKHTHLVFNASLACLCAPLSMFFGRRNSNG
jgi:hypothetical protein